MTSTRNKNNPDDYKLQQRRFEESLQYNQYEYSQVGRAYNIAIPDIGIMPSHMPNCAFSKNPTDIESSLWGINSTNLVKPQPPVKPELKSLKEVEFFDRMKCVMPEPLQIQKNQRPFPI